MVVGVVIGGHAWLTLDHVLPCGDKVHIDISVWEIEEGQDWRDTKLCVREASNVHDSNTLWLL